MGDRWEHSIVLEKRLPVDPGTAYPVCTGGERACPPEDCGGIGGFYDLLDALGDPTHEQHEELQDWVGDDYDPDAFSIDEVNRMIAPRRGRRGKTWSPARLTNTKHTSLVRIRYSGPQISDQAIS
jgi:hypothetical protein